MYECNFHYNIPRAWLLNRSPVSAMDLKAIDQACLWSKSNRSGLWRLETRRRLRRLCRKHSNNVAPHDKTPVKSTRNTNFMSRRSDTMLHHLYIKELKYMHFQFDYLCSVTTYDNFLLLRPVYIIKHSSMKQPDLYYFEAIKMTSQA